MMIASCHFTRGQSAMHQLPETGYLRLPQIIGRDEQPRKAGRMVRPAIPAVIPVSKSTWWQGVKSGRFPKPVKLGPRATAWRVEDTLRRRASRACRVAHDGRYR